MALAVENVQSTSVSEDTDLVITKPTGLAVGDLMLACIVGDTVATPAGWDSEVSLNFSFIFTKTADSSDVAASDFTFTASDFAPLMGSLYRISGQSTSVTVLGTDSDTVAINDPATSGSLSMTTTLTPLVPNSLMILMGGSTSGDNEWLDSVSSRVITGGTNPTWTERYEAHRTDTGNDSTGISVADAIYADETEITNVAASVGIDGSTPDVSARFLFIVLTPLVDEAESATLLQGTPVINAPTTTVSYERTSTLLENANENIPTPTVSVPAKTLTNTSKNDAANVTNTDKS